MIFKNLLPAVDFCAVLGRKPFSILLKIFYYIISFNYKNNVWLSPYSSPTSYSICPLA